MSVIGVLRQLTPIRTTFSAAPRKKKGDLDAALREFQEVCAARYQALKIHENAARRTAATVRNRGQLNGTSDVFTSDRCHFGPQPDTWLFRNMKLGPMFTKYVGSSALPLRQLFSISK